MDKRLLMHHIFFLKQSTFYYEYFLPNKKAISNIRQQKNIWLLKNVEP